MKDNHLPPHTVLESPDLVAFISQTTSFQPRPFIREQDHRVCFAFDTDVSEAIEEFYRNPSIPILDFCKNLKNIRSAIFNMKGTGGRHG